MKHLLFIALLFPLLATSQWQNLKLENSNIVFEKVYNLEGMDSAAIGKFLQINIPLKKDITIMRSSPEVISAKIIGTHIEYKKYGGKWNQVTTFIRYPFYGDVSIVWKDNKYKVTVTNMLFLMEGSKTFYKVSNELTESKATKIANDKISQRTGTYIEQNLSDLFALTPSKNW